MVIPITIKYKYIACRSKHLGIAPKFDFAEAYFRANIILNYINMILCCLRDMAIGYLIVNKVWADKFDNLEGRHVCCLSRLIDVTPELAPNGDR